MSCQHFPILLSLCFQYFFLKFEGFHLLGQVSLSLHDIVCFLIWQDCFQTQNIFPSIEIIEGIISKEDRGKYFITRFFPSPFSPFSPTKNVVFFFPNQAFISLVSSNYRNQKNKTGGTQKILFSCFKRMKGSTADDSKTIADGFIAWRIKANQSFGFCFVWRLKRFSFVWGIKLLLYYKWTSRVFKENVIVMLLKPSKIILKRN